MDKIKEKTKEEKLPEGWKRVRLGKVTEAVKDSFPKGSSPYLEIGDIDVVRKKYYIKEKPSPEHCLIAEKDAIIVSKVRPTRGAIAIIKDNPIFVSPAFLVLKSYNSNFIFYTLSRTDFFTHLGSRETGTTYPSVNDRDILDYEFIIPENVFEQQKIAEILETVDNAIEKTDQIIEKYKRIKQGLMQDLLTKGIDENWHIRSEKTHSFKDSPLGRIPEEWEVDRLGNRAFITKLAGFEYSNYFNSYKDGGDIIVIRGVNITNNKLDLSNIKKIPAETSKNLHRSKLYKNDLVFAYVGTIGPVYLIEEDNKYHLGPNTSKIRVNESVDPKYLFHYFTSQLIKKEITMQTSVSAQPSLSMTKIRNFKIILPPLPEQRRIASVLSQMDETIEKETQYKQKLEHIKQGLMEDLLTGKVKVNHLIDDRETEVNI